MRSNGSWVDKRSNVANSDRVEAGQTIAQRFVVGPSASSGGVGTIYRATDLHTGRAVALKFLHTADRMAAERFGREAAVLAQVRHPSIVHYIAHGATVSGTPFLAMEWLEGYDLRRLLGSSDIATSDTMTEAMVVDDPSSPKTQARGLPLPAVLNLASSLASALTKLHQHSIVHRDVKPANLFLIDGDIQRVKLVDFGAARLTSGDVRVTGTGVVVGTPLYMSPEQARGQKELTSASDVWGLGCVLYECLTGSAPFAADQLSAILARILLDKPRPLTSLRDDVPAAFAELVHRMIAKNPQERPADGKAIQDALEDVLAETMPLLQPTTEPGRVRGLVPVLPMTRDRFGRKEQRVHCVLLALSPLQDKNGDVVEVVESFGGEFDRLANGSLLVTIPKHESASDQAYAAAQAALQLRDAQPDLSIFLAMGTAEGSEATSMAAVLDRAAMGISRVGPGTVGVDQTTAGLLEHRFEVVTRMGDVPLLMSERDIETPRTLLGQHTIPVGRKRELSVLKATFDEAIDEPVARAMLVTADAGVGKSRLRVEFVKTVTAAEPSLGVVLAQGNSLSAGSPFGMMRPALRRFFGVDDLNEPEARRSRLFARLRRVVPEDDVGRVGDFLAELLELPSAGDLSPSLIAARADPSLMSEAIRRAFEDWLMGELSERPLLFVFEDVHWGDVPSLKLIDGALRRLTECPFMVLAFGRPDVHRRFPRLWAERDVQELRLGGLTKRASTELVRQVLATASDSVVMRIVDRADGNAFYLEEMIRAVAEGGGDAMPETILGVVQARLDVLGDEAKHLLRAASIFGETFWPGGVKALLSHDEREEFVDRWLDNLCEREVIWRQAESRIQGEAEYQFRHALIHDGAYSTLTTHDRRLGHRLAGEWLERQSGAEPLAIAEHHIRGAAPQQAVPWLRKAAEQALEGADLEAVTMCALRAEAAGVNGASLGEFRALQAVAAYWQSGYETARRCGQEAAELVQPGSRQWYRAIGAAAVASARMGDPQDLRRWFDVLRTREAEAGAESEQIISLCRAANQMIFAGRFSEADEVLDWVAGVVPQAGDLDDRAWAQLTHARGVRALYVGDIAVFQSALDQALYYFEKAGDLHNLALEQSSMGWVLARLGQLESSLAACFGALDFCQKVGASQAITFAKVNVGYAMYQNAGRAEEARHWLNESIVECAAAGNARLHGWALAHLTYIDYFQGRHREGLEHAIEATEKLKSAPGLRTWALACQARAWLYCEEPHRALTCAQESMKTLDEWGGLLQGEALPPLVMAWTLTTLDHPDARKTWIDARDRLHARARRIAEVGQPEWAEGYLSLPDALATLEGARRVQ